MANPTTNLTMTKPTVGGSTDTWGTTLNEEVVDVIDAVFSVSGTDVSMSDITFNSVALQETGAGTDTVKVQAPSAVTTSYTLTMPAAVGASGQILRTSDASGTLAWVTDEEGDLKSVADATNGGMTVTNGTGPDVTLALNFNDLAAAVVDVAADSIGILDATDDGTKKESIADLVSAMGGTGLTGASGQLSVDAAQTQITSLGTLTALQVDNININLNTISSTAGTDLNITPLTGQQIVLDGTIVIDAGVVTGATSITSTAFVGDVTGNADTATLATLASTVTVEATTNSTCSVALFESVSGSLAAKTDAGLTYNATSNVLAGTFNGALTGNVTGNVTGTAATVTGATQAAITTAANLVTVGALDSGGSITSGFGTINNGSSSITGGAGSFTTLSGSTSLVLASGATVTGIDNGALGSSATLLATQGAIKTYIDAAALQSLSDVLGVGNTTGSVDLIISAGQKIYTDTIAETTSAAGVTIDSVLLKDNVVTATTFIGALTGLASTATTSTNVTAANNVENENQYVAFFDNNNTTAQQVLYDNGFLYNPSTNTLTTDYVAATITTATQASITTAANLVTVGALGSGSIGSGFGNINNGSSSITGGAGSFSSVALATGATVTGIDNATLATGSAVLLATQGAIKSYVDSQVGASDTLAEVLANGNTTGAYDIEVSVGKKISTDTIGELSLAAGVTIDSVLVKDNTVTATTFTGALTGNVTGNVTGSSGSTTGLAATATALATARAINGVDFDGTIPITVTADANTLSNTTLKSTVVTSSLTSVGTLTSLGVGNITSTGNLVVSGTGPHSIGAATQDNVRFRSAGSYTSGGASDFAAGHSIEGTITGAVGDDIALAGAIFQGSIVTQGTDTNISRVAQVMINTPSITNNLASSGKPDIASTLWIQGAPSAVGDADYALYVAAGLTAFGDNVLLASGKGLGPNGANEHLNLFATGAAGEVKFYTAGTSPTTAGSGGGSVAMTMDASADVNIPNGGLGIGTTSSPAVKLDARATSNGGSNEEIITWGRSDNAVKGTLGYNANNYVTMGSETGHSLAIVQGGSADGDIAMFIDGSKNVGIGTDAPANPLHVVGDMRYQEAGDTTNFGIIQAVSDNFVLASYGTAASSGGFIFNVDDGGTSGLTIDASADVNIPNGDLYLAESVYIGGSAALNKLDDYEEGAWTPLIDGSGGTSGQSYTTQSGRYQRVGQVVHCQCVVKLSAKGTITGYARVSGLPLTPNAVPTYNVAANSIAQASISDGHLFYAQQYAGNPFCYLYESDISEDEGLTQVTTSVINDDTEIILSLTYRTDA